VAWNGELIVTGIFKNQENGEPKVAITLLVLSTAIDRTTP
jgi:hypothetical protein